MTDSDNDFRALSYDLIQKILTASKKASIYSFEHALVKESVEDAYQTLKRLLTERGNLTLAAVEGEILADEQQLSPSTADSLTSFIAGKEVYSNRLAQGLADRDMQSATFFQGVSLRELEVFLSALAARPATLAKLGGCIKLLEEKRVSFIQINQVKYGRIEEDELAAEDYLSEVLSNTGSMRADQRKRLMDEVNTNRPKVVKIIEKLSFVETRDGEGNPIKTLNIHFLQNIFSRLDSQLFKGGEPEWRDFRKRVANILIVNHPAFPEVLLNTFEEVPDSVENLVDRLTPDQRNRTIAKLIASEVGQGKMSVKEIIELLKWLVPEEREIADVLPFLENEFIEVGIGDPERSRLLHEVAWDYLPLEQRTERYLREYLALEQGTLKARGLMVSWLAKGDSEQAKRIFQCYLKSLTQPGSEGRQTTARQCLDMALLFEDKGLFKGACGAACRCLLQQLEREEEPKARATLANSLGDIITFNIKENNFDLALSTLTGLKDKAGIPSDQADVLGSVLQEGMKRISSPAVIDSLIRLAQDDQYHDHWPSISQVLKTSPEHSVSPLMNALQGYPRDEIRDRLLDILADMGQSTIAEAVDRLNTDQPAEVRSAVQILGWIGDDADADKLAPAIGHPDKTVRKEVVKALNRIGSRQAARLLAEMLKDKDDEVRRMVLPALGNMAQQDSLPAILEFARRRGALGPGDVTLRKRAIAILGNLRWKEAVPTLVQLAEEKSLGSYREPSEVRVQAVAALGAIGGDEALANLRRLSKGFWRFNSQVREAARAALGRLEKEQAPTP
jgi:HEAT repeat protein